MGCPALVEVTQETCPVEAVRAGRRRGLRASPRPDLTAIKGGGAGWSPMAWGSSRIVDFTAEEVLLSGSNVTAFVDNSGAGLHAVQAVSASQGTYVPSHPGFNGKPAVRMQSELGTSQWYVMPYNGYMGFSHSWFFVLEHGSLEPYPQYLTQGASPYFICEPVSATATNAGYYDGTATHVPLGAGTATIAPRSECYSLDSVAHQGSLHRNGALVGTNAYVDYGVHVARSINGRVTDGSAYVPGLYLHRMTALRRAATVNDLASWFAWTKAHCGV